MSFHLPGVSLGSFTVAVPLTMVTVTVLVTLPLAIRTWAVPPAAARPAGVVTVTVPLPPFLAVGALTTLNVGWPGVALATVMVLTADSDALNALGTPG